MVGRTESLGGSTYESGLLEGAWRCTAICQKSLSSAGAMRASDSARSRRITSFHRAQWPDPNIVAAPAKCFDDWLRKVLVGKEAHLRGYWVGLERVRQVTGVR